MANLSQHYLSRGENQSSAPSFGYLVLQYFGPFPLAGLATILLFYAMYSLVHTDYQPDPVKPTPPIPPIKLDMSETIHTEHDNSTLVKPKLVEPPPPMKLVNPIADPGRSISVTWKMPPPKIKINPTLAGSNQPMPIVRVNPVYPAVAAARGVEGYVDVMFDITTLGSTANIRIIGYSPSSVFNRAVIRAVQGWKYKPSGQKGQAGVIRNVKERITFKMAK